MDILISGLGIAGPTLAWWLERRGFRPVVVERAPGPRTAGYIIDFWGRGFDISEAMGLMPKLREVGYVMEEVRLVDRHGRRRGGFDAKVFAQLAGDKYLSLPRGALSEQLYRAIEGRVETLFGDSVAAIEDRGDSVRVTFEHAPPRDFAMVVGADGIHSRVRELCFGPEAAFEKYLGYGFAAIDLPGYQPRDPLVYVMHAEPGRQIGRFAKRDGSTLALFVDADPEGAPLPETPAAKEAQLRARFAGMGWEAQAMLDAVADWDAAYLDRVSQIRIDKWHKGRVALVGDAAYAPSFLAGQGSALAMVGAYVLAGEIAAAKGDPAVAFARYEARLRDFMDAKQRGAVRFAGSFVPGSWLGVRLREWFTHVMRIPLLTNLAFGGAIRDQFELPAYGDTVPGQTAAD